MKKYQFEPAPNTRYLRVYPILKENINFGQKPVFFIYYIYFIVFFSHLIKEKSGFLAKNSANPLPVRLYGWPFFQKKWAKSGQMAKKYQYFVVFIINKHRF